MAVWVMVITLDIGAGMGRPTCLGDKSRTKGGDLIRQTPLEDPDEGIRTTDRCIVLYHYEAKEGNSEFELCFKC